MPHTVHLENLSLTFSSSVIRINFLHLLPCSFVYGFLLSLWCFSIFTNYCFEVSFSLKVILCAACSQNNSKHRARAPLTWHVSFTVFQYLKLFSFFWPEMTYKNILNYEPSTIEALLIKLTVLTVLQSSVLACPFYSCLAGS